MGEIPFDPDHLIAAGRHRFRVLQPAESGANEGERWRCILCGVTIHPGTPPFIDCEVTA